MKAPSSKSQDGRSWKASGKEGVGACKCHNGRSRIRAIGRACGFQNDRRIWMGEGSCRSERWRQEFISFSVELKVFGLRYSVS